MGTGLAPNIKQSRVFFTHIREGLHVTNERFLQLTNQSSMQGGAFKYEEEGFDRVASCSSSACS
jgi:hypothetical protein